MIRRPPLPALITAAALALLLSGCTAGTTHDPVTSAADVPEAQSESTPAPSAAGSSPAAHVEVDPALYTDEYVAGVSFGVADGQVNCQITESWDDPDVAAWGCAVQSGQTWRWEDTPFADQCAQLEEVGCRNGLVVRGSDAPTPRRNTDSDFGGIRASHLLADGERITVGTVSCEPEGDGIRCADASSGHGFALSAATIEAW